MIKSKMIYLKFRNYTMLLLLFFLLILILAPAKAQFGGRRRFRQCGQFADFCIGDAPSQGTCCDGLHCGEDGTCSKFINTNTNFLQIKLTQISYIKNFTVQVTGTANYFRLTLWMTFACVYMLWQLSSKLDFNNHENFCYKSCK